MREIFLYQAYTNLAYVPPTYRRVKKMRFIIINKDVSKSLVHKKGNKILIWSWNESTAEDLLQTKMSPTLSFSGMYRKSSIRRSNRTNFQ